MWLMTLKEALGLGRGEMVALIGAGGKTTTLFTLAREIWEDGGKVLVTTTTKMFKPAKPHVHRLYVVQEVDALLGEIGKIHEPVIVGAGGGVEATKLVGLPPEWLDTVAQKAGLDAILVEADGAAMRPFKVPADHEPVIPQDCSLTAWIMAIKVLGKPLSPDWVHRAERAALLLGVEPGTLVNEDIILRLVENPRGCLKGIPPKSRRVALINQADTTDEVKKAADLGRALLRHGIERVVITSYLSEDAVKRVLQ